MRLKLMPQKHWNLVRSVPLLLVSFAVEFHHGEVVFRLSMAARSFLVNFFGVNKSPASSEEGKHNQAPVSIPTHTGTNNASCKNSDAILIREAIVDTRNRLCGYRFSSKSIAGGKPVPETLFFEALQPAWTLQSKRWSQPGRLHLHGRRMLLAAAGMTAPMENAYLSGC